MSEDLQESEISLIRKARKKFVALATAYFLGVFNDNFYKQAACLIAVAAGQNEFQGEATILFALPFLLLAAPAGWLADHYSKRNVIVWGKFIEILAMSAGAYGIYTNNWTFIFIMLVLMAAQSTIVSPALNGTIPELYPESYVTKANSLVKLISTSAILIGVLFAGLSIDQKGGAKEKPPFLLESLLKPKELIVYIKNGDDADIQRLRPFVNVGQMATIYESDKKKGAIFIVAEMNRLIQNEKFQQLLQKDKKINKNYFNFENEDKKKATKDDLTLATRKYVESFLSSEIKVTAITKTGRLTVSVVIIVIALIGFMISLAVPKYKAAAPDKPFPFSGPFNTISVIYNIRKDYLLFLTFFGSLIFYLIASLLTLLINSLGLGQFRYSAFDTSLLVFALLLGICIGSLLAGMIVKANSWYKLIPWALLVMGIGLLLMGCVPLLPKTYEYTSIFIFLVIAGTGGGLFIIPTESFIQIRPSSDKKGEVISAGNFMTFVGVLISGKLYIYMERSGNLPTINIGMLGGATILIAGISWLLLIKVPRIEAEREK
ncbi:MAG: hypothetical protein COA79_15310 [Planctomycetota bacterium]|nr:MAG: hypothetical protein COA79_15310 [Planctomycetota bacterium]